MLCHNDFHEGNVLVARDDRGDWRVSGVIDVENMIAADPLIDLAKPDCNSIRGDQAKRAAVLAEYGPARARPWRCGPWPLIREAVIGSGAAHSAGPVRCS